MAWELVTKIITKYRELYGSILFSTMCTFLPTTVMIQKPIIPIGINMICTGDIW